MRFGSFKIKAGQQRIGNQHHCLLNPVGPTISRNYPAGLSATIAAVYNEPTRKCLDELTYATRFTPGDLGSIAYCLLISVAATKVTTNVLVMTDLEAKYVSENTGIDRQNLAHTITIRMEQNSQVVWATMTPEQNWLDGYFAWISGKGSIPEKTETLLFMARQGWKAVCPAPFGYSWFLHISPAYAERLNLPGKEKLANAGLSFTEKGRLRQVFVEYHENIILSAMLTGNDGLAVDKFESVKWGGNETSSFIPRYVPRTLKNWFSKGNLPWAGYAYTDKIGTLQLGSVGSPTVIRGLAPKTYYWLEPFAEKGILFIKLSDAKKQRIQTFRLQGNADDNFPDSSPDCFKNNEACVFVVGK